MFEGLQFLNGPPKTIELKIDLTVNPKLSKFIEYHNNNHQILCFINRNTKIAPSGRVKVIGLYNSLN